MCPGQVPGSRSDTVSERSTTLVPESDTKSKAPPLPDPLFPRCLTPIITAGHGTPEVPAWRSRAHLRMLCPSRARRNGRTIGAVRVIGPYANCPYIRLVDL